MDFHRVVAQQFKHGCFHVIYGHDTLGGVAPVAGTVNRRGLRGGKKGGGPPVLAFGGSRGGEADALTRIGFFSGSGTDATQSARITAKATQEAAKLLAKINDKIDPRPGGGFGNQ